MEVSPLRALTQFEYRIYDGNGTNSRNGSKPVEGIDTPTKTSLTLLRHSSLPGSDPMKYTTTKAYSAQLAAIINDIIHTTRIK